MEQLKPILEVLKKHHFWVVCLVAVGAVVGGWYMAVGAMEPVFNENKKAVSGLFSKYDLLNNDQKQAGETWHADGDAKTKEWHDNFIDEMKTLEAKQEKQPPKDIEDLRKIVNIEIDDPRAARGEVKKITVEVWNPESFEAFKKSIEAPSPASDPKLDLQERMGIAKAILSSVAAINKSSPDKLNMYISAIEVFEIGQEALRNPVVRQVETSAPNPAGPAPAANPPGPGAPGASPAAAAPKAPAKKPGPPAAAPPVLMAMARTVPGFRAYPVRVRMKMVTHTLPDFVRLLLNEKIHIVIDDLRFANVVKTLHSGRPAPTAPPATALGRPGPAGAPGTAAKAAAKPGPQEPGAPDQAPPTGPPHLVQVPRESVVEFQATIYAVDMAQVKAFRPGAPK